ncbi:nicotinamide riboside transporter PnuC [Mucilaginibacter litoreus]|uniref:Nicotinamide riboside transporter PnuC n=1 Tax=Mucilaginibacter litoreus TaxID=1048221 RepID=A0ABW3AX29_9SPHI
MQIIDGLQNWWQHQNWLEVIAVVTGLLCVYLAAKNNIWNWPFAIISVSLYLFIFFEARLFADMGLQVYFLCMNIYGWWYWSRASMQVKVPVKQITLKEIWLSAAAITACTFLLGTVLKYTPASFPYLDSFLAACSLVAQVFLARKVLQNWLIWVFVDVVYVGVYLVKGLHLTAAMYAVYVVIAAMGYLDWKKEYKLSSIKN